MYIAPPFVEQPQPPVYLQLLGFVIVLLKIMDEYKLTEPLYAYIDPPEEYPH